MRDESSADIRELLLFGETKRCLSGKPLESPLTRLEGVWVWTPAWELHYPHGTLVRFGSFSFDDWHYAEDDDLGKCIGLSSQNEVWTSWRRSASEVANTLGKVMGHDYVRHVDWIKVMVSAGLSHENSSATVLQNDLLMSIRASMSSAWMMRGRAGGEGKRSRSGL